MGQEIPHGSDLAAWRSRRHPAREPVARLVTVGARPPRTFGADRGRLVLPPDFDAPLTDDALATFEH
ncbi:MAG: hypothetical protein ACRDYZ_02045 [Acidimicrobiales bacterium]